MASAPLVSVIIPTYNYAHFIGEAIESVLASDFPLDQLELIIIDDGSTDNTSEVVGRYGDRLLYLQQPNQGKAQATQVGIAQARGRYIFNLDADDLFLPHKIRMVVERFEQDASLTHVSHPALCWDVNSDQKVPEAIPTWMLERSLPGEQLLEAFYQRNFLFGGGSTFAARADVLKCASIPPSVDMFIDEYLVLLAVNGGTSYFINHPLSIWRVHHRNYSQSMGTAGQRSRQERSLNSMRAVGHTVLSDTFPASVKYLYPVKLTVAQLAIQETYHEKTLLDILHLWMLVFQLLPHFPLQWLRILKAYTVVNRSLPTPLLMALKRLKYGY